MTRQQFKQLTASKRLILDGATGSCLLAAGMPRGVCPEQWILKHSEILVRLQTAYLDSGTDILYAPTFSGNRVKLAEYGLSDRVRQMNHGLVALSKQAVSRAGREGSAFVAADLTMTGKQLAPIGTMDFEELVDVYKEQARCCVEAGADLFVVETMMSLQECRAALLAIRETCDLPVMVTLTFREDGRTFHGNSPETAAIILGKMGADAVGMNCSAGPDQLLGFVERMAAVSEVPVIVKPNAGLPVLKDGETVYDMAPEEFVEHMEAVLRAGAAIVGGCCGTTPEYIKGLAAAAKKFAPVASGEKHLRCLATERSVLDIDLDGRFLVIGERINPTGKKALQAALKEGDLTLVEEMAQEQVEAGADILDINMGMNGIDEKAMMLSAVETVSGLVDVPLCIDSSHPEIIEAALRRYPGRALINSVSLEAGKMERLLPAAKKYGAMFILLPLSQTGLPKDMEEKKQIIRRILDEAKACGLGREDVFVDGLVNTVGANRDAAAAAAETIRYCKEELGVATMCGLSNISFGLPQRPIVNAAFLAFSVQAGITAAIVNPSQRLLMNMAAAADLLCGKEGADIRYIERATAGSVTLVETAQLEELKHRAAQEAGRAGTSAGFGDLGTGGLGNGMDCENLGTGGAGSGAGFVTLGDAGSGSSERPNGSPEGGHPPNARNALESAAHKVHEAVIKGSRKAIVSLTKDALSAGFLPQDILNGELIPAINEVGELFNRQKYFLPQLIASAEAMKTAVEYLEPLLSENAQPEKLGVVVIATVAGDIHDIGKNLVVLMLKNYGFDVHDLGKDVPTEEIIRAAQELDADIIAVSALMTTTMLEMKEVVRQRDAAGLRAKVMIGGAVITQSYCDEIHADGYSKDAQEAVALARRLVSARHSADGE